MISSKRHNIELKSQETPYAAFLVTKMRGSKTMTVRELQDKIIKLKKELRQRKMIVSKKILMKEN